MKFYFVDLISNLYTTSLYAWYTIRNPIFRFLTTRDDSFSGTSPTRHRCVTASARFLRRVLLYIWWPYLDYQVFISVCKHQGYVWGDWKWRLDDQTRLKSLTRKSYDLLKLLLMGRDGQSEDVQTKK